jgi:hypothetical protein
MALAILKCHSKGESQIDHSGSARVGPSLSIFCGTGLGSGLGLESGGSGQALLSAVEGEKHFCAKREGNGHMQDVERLHAGAAGVAPGEWLKGITTGHFAA